MEENDPDVLYYNWYLLSAPKPKEMPRTVELFYGFCENRTDELKYIYLAGLGLYPMPDERGVEYQRELMEKRFDKLTGKSSEDSTVTSLEENTSSSEISNEEIVHINSISDNTTIEETNISSGCPSVYEDNWDVKLNIIITPVRRKGSTDTVTNSEYMSDNWNDSINEDKDEWQYFGNYIEDQLKNEPVITPSTCVQEIKEAKLKLNNLVTEWSYLSKKKRVHFDNME